MESEVLNAEGMFVRKININLIIFVADSGASEHLTNEVENQSEVMEEVAKMKGVNKNLQADIEIKMKGVIKTKNNVSHIIILKNIFYNKNESRNILF